MGIQGEEDAQNSNRLTDFSKNAAARIFLDGAIGVINHKDQGILMKEMALQAMKPQGGSTSGKKTNEAQDEFFQSIRLTYTTMTKPFTGSGFIYLDTLVYIFCSLPIEWLKKFTSRF